MEYIIIVLLLLGSAFFSGTEIAYSAANHLRMEKAADNGSRRAKVAYYIITHYEKALSTVLIGNNLVNIAASSIATMIAVRLLGDDIGALCATVIMTVLVLLFGEIAPKIVAKKRSNEFATAVSIPVRILMIIFSPILFVVLKITHLFTRFWNKNGNDNAVTEDDLASIIETVEDEGVIDEERGELLQNALDFSEISAQEVMTPRVDMVAIDIDEDFDTILNIVSESNYSRIPVYEDSIDNVIGVLYLNHFYKHIVDNEKIDLRSILINACFVYKKMKLPAVLAELKKRKLHQAIVTDDYGGTMGLVTMEDILEQLVGEIWDETDEIVDEFRCIGENAYEVSGDMSIGDFREALDIEEDDDESDSTTVGGWVLEMFKNKFPEQGESFDYMNITVTVIEMDTRRVDKIRVDVHLKNNDGDEEEE